MLALLSLLIALLFPSLALAQPDWTFCAQRTQQCEFSGTKEVRYGVAAQNLFSYSIHIDGVLCDDPTLDDPAVGIEKECWYRDAQNGETPPPVTVGSAILVPGTAMTWTDGNMVWSGNPFCGGAGAVLQATSPAIDKGVLIPGLHCPNPGSALGQPGIPDGFGDTGISPCVEWYGAAPDIGACEFVPGLVGSPPSAPTELWVT